MANIVKTLTNSIRLFGPATPTQWGVGSLYTMTWGVSKWGEGTVDTKVMVNPKLIANTLGVVDAFPKVTEKQIQDTIGTDFEMSSESLKSGNWNYVFPKPTIDAEDRDASVWTTASSAIVSWSCQAAASTSWRQQ